VDTIHQRNPWRHEIDYYGICVVVHSLLHGRYLEVVQEGGRWEPKTTLKRYWQTHLWSALIDTLLNVPKATHRVDLAALRRPFEDHLEETSHRTPTLKDLLREQETLFSSL